MNINPDVDDWFTAFEHPLLDALQRVREIMLKADPRIKECIKWKSPTFTYKGNIASINPRSKKKVSIMFHQGAKIPGEHPRLEGGGGTVKYMYFANLDEVNDGAADLTTVVQAWCELQG